jgi:transketolase
MTNQLTALPSEEIKNLENFCSEVRKDILKMVHAAKSGHPGGSLSAVEIISTLYKKCMKQDPLWDKSPDFEKRDRFVLSKGHASPALYSVLAGCGYFPKEDLLSFRKLGSCLQGHPCCKALKGIEVSTGSLGQGLSIACGIALGLKLDKNPANVFVLLGDGELQEGSVWEAFMNASHYKLNNIIAFVDRNRLQIDGNTEQVKSLDPLDEKLEAFNWNVITVDGHSVEEIYDAVCLAKTMDSPTAIIADTLKGKGVSFMENNAGWHGKAPSDAELEKALLELK